MRRTEVFILYEHPLFARGLERLLQGVRHLGVSGTAPWSGVEALPEGAMQADVVILEKSPCARKTEAGVARLLTSRPEGRVLCLGLEDNQVTVYSSHSQTVTQRSHLIRALGHPTTVRGPGAGDRT